MNILLTGCSKGLGLYICRLLLEKGYNVFGISRTITPELKQLISNSNNNLVHLVYDLSDCQNVQSAIFNDFIGKSKIDAFVNNAAIAYDDIITNLNIDPLIQMFNVNVFTPFLITKYVIRNMILNKTFGSIVHLSSISVHTGYKGLSMYAATKGALEAF